MTDIPQGTKRRGSTELDDVPETDQMNGSDPASKSNGTLDSLKPLKLGVKKKTGHRRRNTDGNLNYTPNGTTFFKSARNSDVIKLMQSELPPSAQATMQKKQNDLTLERELKHAQIKLREAEEQRNTAVEIIGNLQRENEDMVQQVDVLRTQFDAMSTELKISEQKVQSLEELYRADTAKYKDEVDNTKKQLSELEENINQKDMQLNEAKEYQKSMQQRMNDIDIVNNGNQGQHEEEDYAMKQAMASKQQKKYESELSALKSAVTDKDGKIERLLQQLEAATRAEYEKNSLQKEMDNLNAMAQSDLMFQREQMEKMTQEIMQLASRNSALEKEREDLINLLEERDYENAMLKTGYGLHRSKTSRNNDDLSQMVQHLDADVMNANYDETLDNLEEYADDQDYEYMNDEDALQLQSNMSSASHRDSQSNGSSSHQKAAKVTPPKKEKKVKEVADVTREYLHLTASVVSMKFPRVRNISSDELINKVKNYQFWEYHEMMVNIMKTEEQKLLAKQKEEQQAKQQANAAQNNQGGALWSFRNFFGNSKGGRQRSGSGANKVRASVIVGHGAKAVANAVTRVRGLSNNSQQKKINESNDTSINRAKKTVKNVKDQTVKKLTGNPTEKESADLAKQGFQSVSSLSRMSREVADKPDDENKGAKPKKPDQTL